MKSFNSAVLTLLFAAMASTVHADGAKSSVFSCGFKAGGNDKVQKVRFESRSKKQKNYAMSFNAAKDVQFETPATARPSAIFVGRYREPPKLTITSFRCTW